MNRIAVSRLTIALALALPACADAPTAPSQSQPQATIAALGGGIRSHVVGGIMSIPTATGTFLLNFNDNSIVTARGITLTDVPGEVMANVANVAQGIADNPAAYGELLASGTDTTNGGWDCAHGWCEYLTAPRGTPESGPLHGGRPAAPKANGMARGRVSPAHTVGFAPVGRPRSNSASPCVDMALAIYDGVARLKTAKHDYEVALDNLEHKVIEHFDPTDSITTSALSLVIPYDQLIEAIRSAQEYQENIEFAVSYFYFETAMTSWAEARLALDVDAVTYTTLGCWNPYGINWPLPTSATETIPGPDLGGGTTQYGWACTERLVIGPDSYPHPVTSCEYIFSS